MFGPKSNAAESDKSMRAVRDFVVVVAAVGGFVGLLAALLPWAPAAADEAMEAVYSEYQQSIEVARQCRKLEFDQAQEQAMGAVINARIKGDIGAKRLSLLTAAQREARRLVKKKGCDGAEPQRLLGLFDQDLAPALD